MGGREGKEGGGGDGMGSHFLTMTGKKESTFKTGTSSILLTYANFIAGWVGMSLHWLPPTKVRLNRL